MSKDEKYYKKLELIRNIFVAGASIIPYAGGTISFFLRQVSTERHREKKD